MTEWELLVLSVFHVPFYSCGLPSPGHRKAFGHSVITLETLSLVSVGPVGARSPYRVLPTLLAFTGLLFFQYPAPPGLYPLPRHIWLGTCLYLLVRRNPEPPTLEVLVFANILMLGAPSGPKTATTSSLSISLRRYRLLWLLEAECLDPSV